MEKKTVRSGIIGAGFAATFHYEAVQQVAGVDAEVVGVFTERDLLRRVVDPGKDPDATRISKVMTSPVHSCSASDDIDDCFDVLHAHEYRHLLVLDNNEPVGVISLRDVAILLRDSAG